MRKRVVGQDGVLIGTLVLPDHATPEEVQLAAAALVAEREYQARWDPLDGLVRCGECPITAKRLKRSEMAEHIKEHERVRDEQKPSE
jgi:hypothetical protein